MLKFLHTADLHLGKTFYELPLIEDQSYALDQIAEILRDPSYRALVIAGDVYDRSVPSPEAVRLFGSFLARLKSQNPSLELLIIPGNHDSPARLGFGRELFAELGIHLAGEAEGSFEPVILRALPKGKGEFKGKGEPKGKGEMENMAGNEGCAFFLLPFLNPGSLSGGTEDDSPEPELLRSQAQLASEAARRLEQGRRRWADRGIPYAVLAAHLFAGGGRESESERIFLGGAEKVDMGLFGAFDYVALGHLHRCQRAGQNGWYSGSPLAYSFDEAGSEKFVLSVEIGVTDSDGVTDSGGGEAEAPEHNGKTRVRPLPIKPLHRVSRLSGPFERFNHPSPQDTELLEAAEDYIEFSLSDSSLTENALPLLQARYPRLLSVRQDSARRGLGSGRPELPVAPGGPRDTAADFEEFLISLYGQADPGKLKLFRELLSQAEAEEREVPQSVPEGKSP
ncbi:MAG: exonuclease subunit SbcD [Treponema sp.]|nr:exonuclease subunit SbcD [Treponema sp.]